MYSVSESRRHSSRAMRLDAQSSTEYSAVWSKGRLDEIYHQDTNYTMPS